MYKKSVQISREFRKSRVLNEFISLHTTFLYILYFTKNKSEYIFVIKTCGSAKIISLQVKKKVKNDI